jgi:hypothetical protein
MTCLCTPVAVEPAVDRLRRLNVTTHIACNSRAFPLSFLIPVIFLRIVLLFEGYIMSSRRNHCIVRVISITFLARVHSLLLRLSSRGESHSTEKAFKVPDPWRLESSDKGRVLVSSLADAPRVRSGFLREQYRV